MYVAIHPSNTINGKSLRTKLLDMIGMYKEVLCLTLFLVLHKVVVKLLQIMHVCMYNQVATVPEINEGDGWFSFQDESFIEH